MYDETKVQLQVIKFGKKDVQDIELVKHIKNIRDAQNLNMKKTLDKFFQNPVDSLALEAANYPDYETMNVGLMVTVFYIWSQMGNRSIPKNIVSANEPKLKKGEFKIAPEINLQKEVWKTDVVNNNMKADVYRYMRYILQNSQPKK